MILTWLVPDFFLMIFRNRESIYPFAINFIAETGFKEEKSHNDPILNAKVLQREMSLYDKQFYIYNQGYFHGVVGEDINISRVDKTLINGSGITVLVNDNGVLFSHNDIKNGYKSHLSYNYYLNSNSPEPPRPKVQTHGTSVVGIIASKKDGHCISGISPNVNWGSTLIVFNGVRVSNVMSAFRTGFNEVDIQSNSWSFEACENGLCPCNTPYSAISQTLQNLTLSRNGKGQVLVFAGGNDGLLNSDVNFLTMANSKHAICVSASTNTGQRALYSNRGTAIMLNAPSANRESLETDAIFSDPHIPSVSSESTESCTLNFGGTSAATPIVAAVAALVLQVNPGLKWNDVHAILISSSTRNDPYHFLWKKNEAGFWYSPHYGFGRVNAGMAIELATKWNTTRNNNDSIDTYKCNQTKFINSFDIEEFSFEVREANIETVLLFIAFRTEQYSQIMVDVQSPSGMISHPKVINSLKEYGDLRNHTMLMRDFYCENSKGKWIIRVRNSGASMFELMDLNLEITNIQTPFINASSQSIGNNPESYMEKHKDFELSVDSIIYSSNFFYVELNVPKGFSCPVHFYVESLDQSNKILIASLSNVKDKINISLNVPSSLKNMSQVFITAKAFLSHMVDSKIVTIINDMTNDIRMEPNYTLYPVKTDQGFTIKYNSNYNISHVSPHISISIYDIENLSICLFRSIVPNTGYIRLTELPKAYNKTLRIIVSPLECIDIRFCEPYHIDIQMHPQSFMSIYIALTIISIIVIFASLYWYFFVSKKLSQNSMGISSSDDESALITPDDKINQAV